VAYCGLENSNIEELFKSLKYWRKEANMRKHVIDRSTKDKKCFLELLHRLHFHDIMMLIHHVLRPLEVLKGSSQLILCLRLIFLQLKSQGCQTAFVWLQR
jgi:hypothetical protein